jgi:hypothetical protein
VPRDPGRQCITETQPVGQRPKSVQSDVGHHPRPTGFHHDATSAVTAHFGSALLVGLLLLRTQTASPGRRAFPRMCGDQINGRREEAGLAEAVADVAPEDFGCETVSPWPAYQTGTPPEH